MGRSVPEPAPAATGDGVKAVQTVDEPVGSRERLTRLLVVGEISGEVPCVPTGGHDRRRQILTIFGVQGNYEHDGALGRDLLAPAAAIPVAPVTTIDLPARRTGGLAGWFTPYARWLTSRVESSREARGGEHQCPSGLEQCSFSWRSG